MFTLSFQSYFKYYFFAYMIVNIVIIHLSLFFYVKYSTYRLLRNIYVYSLCVCFVSAKKKTYFTLFFLWNHSPLIGSKLIHWVNVCAVEGKSNLTVFSMIQGYFFVPRPCVGRGRLGGAKSTSHGVASSAAPHRGAWTATDEVGRIKHKQKPPPPVIDVCCVWRAPLLLE